MGFSYGFPKRFYGGVCRRPGREEMLRQVTQDGALTERELKRHRASSEEVRCVKSTGPRLLDGFGWWMGCWDWKFDGKNELEWGMIYGIGCSWNEMEWKRMKMELIPVYSRTFLNTIWWLGWSYEDIYEMNMKWVIPSHSRSEEWMGVAGSFFFGTWIWHQNLAWFDHVLEYDFNHM